MFSSLGPFIGLDAESISEEVEDMWRTMSKLTKIFMDQVEYCIDYKEANILVGLVGWEIFSNKFRRVVSMKTVVKDRNRCKFEVECKRLRRGRR